MSSPTILLFGPNLLSFDLEQYTHLRSTIQSNSRYGHIIVKTIAELPEWWQSIARVFPHLQALPGAELLRVWHEDLSTSKPPQLTFPIPTTILTPMVVVTQLVQYLEYRDTTKQQALPPAARKEETLGFCTGLLTAFAVASSATPEQFEKYAAVAIRLAMLIGAIVGALEAPSSLGESVSYSIMWNSPQLFQKIEEILLEYPQTAHISVLSDEKRATLTVSENCAVALVQKLKGIEVRVTDLALRGRFHSRHHHDNYIDAARQFCDSNTAFQFPDASQLVLPTQSNTDPGYITQGKLHHIALESILLHQCRWYQAVSSLTSRLVGSNFEIISLSSERCLPPSLLSKLGSRVIHAADLQLPNRPRRHPEIREVSDSDIAVIGMACKLPGADDLEEFWNLLCEGDSQHEQVPEERMKFESSWREADSKRKWYGNFIRDHDAFDHKFFKKSPREAAAMDPQQRLMLQTAYQAVAQAGYFSGRPQPKVGCYIGVSNVDYENNVACYAANAYSATGALKSFVAGKVSHYFGWTGPSLTIDTACSAAAVALHHACQAILVGDCTEALAGGVNILGGPIWYQNLAGASFLSPTGPCKPFDVRADGYCRGEGCGAVYLKKARAAIADGDQIFGIIAGTAVQQNENCTPITVPNDKSLSDLFVNVLRKADIAPSQVSVVEAHGTGTAVGDPAEYESLCRVLGGSVRSGMGPLSLRSVKSLVGHLECASGIVALLKILLMLQKTSIPPQVGFETMNPAIKATPADKMEISTKMKPWQADFRAALINNYGASGSNASVVVMEAPQSQLPPSKSHSLPMSALKYHPFWFSALDQASLQAYCTAFLSYLRSIPRSMPLSDLSFNLSTQSNRSLAQNLIFSCGAMEELEETLRRFQSGHSFSTARRSERPVILCFGGQVSTSIGLNLGLFENVTVLRVHLDECNSVCQSLGLDGIYPEIFQKTPIQDTVKLQLALFAIQYSCAKAWIACNVEVAAVVGHSFGELTSLCIAGVLSLHDAVRLIAGRAQLVRDSWGEDKGAMIAVEADRSQIDSLIDQCNQDQEHGLVSIACVNGPRSFTLAGPVKVMDRVQALQGKPQFTSLRMKRLNVSNAFHSTLVEPLMADLERVGEGLVFHPPTIAVENATESKSAMPSSAVYVAEHMRYPVYFNNAVQRLAKQYPSAIWLEAGSNSTITVMAARALGNPSSSHFQAVNLVSETSSFVDMFTALWSQGLDVTFWPHNRKQSTAYSPLLLPPYQFEKSHHLLEMKAPPKLAAVAPPETAPDEHRLWSFLGYQDSQQGKARFLIHTNTKRFKGYIEGHTVAHSAPLCPSTLQLELAIETIRSLHPEFAGQNLQPQLQGLDNHNPICLDPTRTVWLDAEAQGPEHHLWKWEIISKPTSSSSNAATSLHVSGSILFRSTEDAQFQMDFTRFERLVDHQQCVSLLGSDDADDIIQGRQIYKSFAEVVDYSAMYQGVRKVVGKGNRSAGRVVMQYTGDTWLDCPLCDSFCQVAGLFVNCMSDISTQEAFISNRVEQLIRTPRHPIMASPPDSYDVLAIHSRPSDKIFLSDVFVFDPRNGELLGVILGIQYQKVNKVALGKMMNRLTPGKASMEATTVVPVAKPPHAAATLISAVSAAAPGKNSSPSDDVYGRVVELLANVSGANPAEIHEHTCLADIGIDSLMAMELARDIEGAFNCTLDPVQLMELTDCASLVRCLHTSLGIVEDGSSTTEDKNDSQNEMIETPATSSEEEEDEPPVAVKEKDAINVSRYADPENPQRAVDEYVCTFTQEFLAPVHLPISKTPVVAQQSSVVLVTGATGSLGSHLVAHLASQPGIQTVICLNRCNGNDPEMRQSQALESRSISLSANDYAKLKVFESDTSKPLLGLPDDLYQQLAHTVTHIVHNAWPMTINRPVRGFELQFQTMRNLIDLARTAAGTRPQGFKFAFQFISSIATVGLYPLWSGKTLVPEERMTVDSTLPSGYGLAKLICEGMLEATLQQYPDTFNAAVVRIGQVSGSTLSGYWNPVEHLSFLFKSAQTLNAFPDFQGELSWCPVNDVAAILGDILLQSGSAYPIYHVENPTRQSWTDISSILAQELGIASDNIVPFDQWLARMQQYSDLTENPALRIEAFLDDHFIRMACGGLILDTKRTREHSAHLRKLGAISPDSVRKYIQQWRQIRFLK